MLLCQIIADAKSEAKANALILSTNGKSLNFSRSDHFERSRFKPNSSLMTAPFTEVEKQSHFYPEMQ